MSKKYNYGNIVKDTSRGPRYGPENKGARHLRRKAAALARKKTAEAGAKAFTKAVSTVLLNGNPHERDKG